MIKKCKKLKRSRTSLRRINKKYLWLSKVQETIWNSPTRVFEMLMLMMSWKLCLETTNNSLIKLNINQKLLFQVNCQKDNNNELVHYQIPKSNVNYSNSQHFLKNLMHKQLNRSKGVQIKRFTNLQENKNINRVYNHYIDRKRKRESKYQKHHWSKSIKSIRIYNSYQ
jgi:hypothetical protein